MHTIYHELEAEHREIQRLLDRLEAGVGEAGFDQAGRRYLVERLVTLASRHEASEELTLWPAVRRGPEGGEALAARALEQERDARYLLDALRTAPSEASLIEETRELADLLRAHMALEESQAWPALRRVTTGPGGLLLGAKLRLSARAAPTRPHPRGPDSPSGLATRGAMAAMVDRARDRLSGRRDVVAAGDIGGDGSAEDAVSVLRAHHGLLESLLVKVEGPELPGAHAVDDLVRELSIHDAIERQHLYPLMRRRIANGNDLYAHWIVEHGEVAALLAQIDRRIPTDPYRRDLLDRLIPLVRTHITEEEGSALPALQARLAPEELLALGRTLEAAKAKAPTRPHRFLAGAGLGARLSGALARPVDRARDTVSRRR